MARPTQTRKQLRQSLAVRLSMPFSLRVSSGEASPSAGGSTTTLVDTVNLGQAADFWNNQWVYISSLDQTRKVTDFATGTLTLEYALPSATATSDVYELHSVYNAIEIHNAINQAIREGYPAFFDVRESNDIIVQENKTVYDLTSITPQIGNIHEVYIERPAVRMFGTVASSTDDGTDETVTLDEIDLSSVDTDWYMSCYYGTGEGFVKQVKSVSDLSNTVTLDGMPTISPVDGDKVLLWDSREQYLDWYRMKYVRAQPKEWPAKLFLNAPIEKYVGSRLKIVYSTVPQELTADTDETVIPKEYIMLSAMATLFGSRVNDNKVDRQRYATLQEINEQAAEIYRRNNFFRRPDTELWLEGRDISFEDTIPDGNPLGWE